MECCGAISQMGKYMSSEGALTTAQTCAQLIYQISLQHISREGEISFFIQYAFSWLITASVGKIIHQLLKTILKFHVKYPSDKS